ncbi:MAG: hypothetical protein JOZ24_07855, partial [Candidatus Eremiobacteraeota bacterium]|nr:hypothetical protein [Candidatus Eremiobacteraeota bacterium]
MPLDVATKRHLAERLTAAVLERMPAARPEWTAVHFTPYRADEFAAAGLLVSDGAPAAAHLEVEAHDVDERTWRRLRRDLSNVLTGVLQRGADTVPITLKLNRYDAHTFAAG